MFLKGRYLVVKSLSFSVVFLFLLPRLLTACWYLEGMLTIHATGSATAPLIANCSFAIRVVGFIINDFF